MGQMHPFERKLNISIDSVGIIDYAEITYMKVKRIVKLSSINTIALELSTPEAEK